MKSLQTKLIKRSISACMLITLFAFSSCESKGQKTESEGNAPQVTIHEAAFMGDLDALKSHIAAKSDLNQKDEYGSAPLNIAALFGKPEIAKLLVEAGADLNVKSGDGSTPLHTAAFFCREGIVKLLLENGADISVRNNYGSTALESIIAPFNDVKPIYDQMSRNLGPFGLKLDYAQIEATRPVIVELIKSSK